MGEVNKFTSTWSVLVRSPNWRHSLFQIFLTLSEKCGGDICGETTSVGTFGDLYLQNLVFETADAEQRRLVTSFEPRKVIFRLVFYNQKFVSAGIKLLAKLTQEPPVQFSDFRHLPRFAGYAHRQVAVTVGGAGSV